MMRTLMPTATPLAVSEMEAAPTAPMARGELHLVVREDIKTINPFTVSNNSEQLLVDLVYDTLLDTASQSTLRGNLAQRWEFYPAGRSLTFWIDPRARWHDGQPVTADDVVYSFSLVRQKQFSGWVALVSLVDRVEARSTTEVHFSLLSTQGDVTQQLGTKLPIVPAHIWRYIPEPSQFNNWDNTIGSGPFRVSEHIAGERIVLSSTAHHHSPARVNTLVVEIVRNEDQAIQLLKDSKADLVGWDISATVASTVKRQPKAYPGILISESPGTVVHSLIPNLRKAPFDDARFRRALTQAIDVQSIISESLHGFAEPAVASLFPSASVWRVPSITPVPLDKAQAASTLESLGFKDRDGDGVRERMDGTKLQVSIACADLPSSVQVAQLVAAHWKALGIAVTVTRVSQDAVLSTLMEAQFDIVLTHIALENAQAALLSFHSSKGMVNGGTVFGENYGGYSSATCDEVLASLWEEHDPGRQAGLYADLQAILAEDLPQIPLYCPYVLNLHREDRFAGWTPQLGLGLVTRSTLTGLEPL
jgi:peptide/nickel transport system substrate-binding protein